jgi:hypothetical protein
MAPFDIVSHADELQEPQESPVGGKDMVIPEGVVSPIMLEAAGQTSHSRASLENGHLSDPGPGDIPRRRQPRESAA